MNVIRLGIKRHLQILTSKTIISFSVIDRLKITFSTKHLIIVSACLGITMSNSGKLIKRDLYFSLKLYYKNVELNSRLGFYYFLVVYR